MFRRRPFVRPLGRAVAANVPPLLRRANELMAAGDHAAAAQAYERLAFGARQRGLPQDARLLLQAGRARLLAGQIPAGIDLLKQGLSTFAGRGQTAQVQGAASRILAELNERGLAAEAAGIEAHLRTLLPGGVARPASAPAAASARPVLPTRCPGCGAPLRPDEVEWLDDLTAECPFCGSAVRAD